jgi:hypothetical protein
MFSFLLILLIIIYNYRVYDNFSLENFQNYNEDEIYNNKKIVASYYINDKNISKLKEIIDLISKQTVKLNQFCINIPERLKEFIDESYVKNNDIIQIHFIKRDFINCNGLIPTYLREKNGNALFIIFGEDILKYVKDINFLKKLVIQYHTENNNKVLVSTCNNKTKGTFITCVSNFNIGLVDNISTTNKELYNCESWYKKNINNDVKFLEYKM